MKKETLVDCFKNYDLDQNGKISFKEFTDMIKPQNEKEDEKNIIIELKVDASDMGKVIGRQGRIAKAIRAVVKAASSKCDKKVSVEILE